MKEEGLTKEELSLLLEIMPNNRGLLVDIVGERMSVVFLNEGDFKKLNDDKDLLHVVGMWTRPFVHYFANYLEYEHFPPEQEVNKEMQYRVIRWHGALWSIVSVPLIKKNLVEEAAEKAHLKLADGVPIFMGKESVLMCFAAVRPSENFQNIADFFPVRSDSTFTLEQSKSDDVVYEPGGSQDAKMLEEFEINQLWKKHGKDKIEE